MIHLIYVSSATRELSKDELLLLLKKSRDRNKRQNVTGMLLFAGGCFIQVLEGAEKDVEEIYENIVNDDRNTENEVIIREEISERMFPDWSMGFKYLSAKNIEEIMGYTEFLDRNMTPVEIASRSGETINLLYLFKDIYV